MALAGCQTAPVTPPAASSLAVVQPVEDPVTVALRTSLSTPGADAGIVAFYQSRAQRPLWVSGGQVTTDAQDLLARLQAAANDGLDPAAYAIDSLQADLARAKDGDPGHLAAAELALSGAAAAYFSDLHRARSGADLLYSDKGMASPALTGRAVLERLSGAPSLAQGLTELARMSPIYERLRAALADDAAHGGVANAVLRANLERARALPGDLGHRYVLVDITAQRLTAYQDGQVVQSMKVVVGKPSEPTPSMAALIRYAVFRPYWNVPPDLVEKRIAPGVLKQGVSRLTRQQLEVLSDWSDQATVLDPKHVDWKAVAAGRQTLRIRQDPGKDNMMGRVKFMFPNDMGVYLHDSPLRVFFAGDVRLNSSGCVRLEDAISLAHWLLADEVVAQGEAPGPAETRVDLAEPVPVYIVYFTAMPTGSGLEMRKDVYGSDASLIAELTRPLETPPVLATR
jgi:murein L,D-transpeptidase YcbB/YkuD